MCAAGFSRCLDATRDDRDFARLALGIQSAARPADHGAIWWREVFAPHRRPRGEQGAIKPQAGGLV